MFFFPSGLPCGDYFSFEFQRIKKVVKTKTIIREDRCEGEEGDFKWETSQNKCEWWQDIKSYQHFR